MNTRHFAIILAAALLLSTGVGLFIGCDDNSLDRSLKAPDLAAAPFEEVETEYGTVIDAQVDSEDPETHQRLQEVLDLEIIQEQMAMFDSTYTYAWEYSFILSGTYVPDSSIDTIDVEATTIAMTYDADLMQRVLYINLVDLGNIGWMVQSSEVSFVPESSEDGWDYVDLEDSGAIWVRTYAPTTNRYGPQSQIAWSWKKWLICSAIGTVSGCAGFAVKCLGTGPAYAHCLGVGCAGSAVASTVGCALKQVLNDD